MLQRFIAGATVRVGELSLTQEGFGGSNRQRARTNGTASKRAKIPATDRDAVRNKRLRRRDRFERAGEPAFG